MGPPLPHLVDKQSQCLHAVSILWKRPVGYWNPCPEHQVMQAARAVMGLPAVQNARVLLNVLLHLLNIGEEAGLDPGGVAKPVADVHLMIAWKASQSER